MNISMCYTAKGWAYALIVAFLAALFVAVLVTGYNTQQAGLVGQAVVHYFIAFLLLGATKHCKNKMCEADMSASRSNKRGSKRR